MADSPATPLATEAPSAASVELRDFSLSVAGRALLKGVSLVFPAGKVSLIVGASGAGKSLLLRALAGLLDRNDLRVVAISGKALVGEREVSPDRPTDSVGVVFQSFALFDELSPLENVRFARRQASSRSHARRGEELAPARLLEELHVPAHVPTPALSGGQKQRLAIARTLAYDPQVILYDEPTSGLDTVAAQRVARMIGETHEAHPKTSLVVTHDHQALCKIADHVFLFDPVAGELREVARSDWPHLGEQIVAPAAGDDSQPPTTSLAARVLARAGTSALEFFAATSRAAEAALAAPLRLAPLWRSPYWGLRFLAHYLALNAGPSAWLYMAIAGAIVGYVTTYFSFRFMPYAQVTRPLLTEELLTSIGFALFRVLTPILATVLIAARSGAASASDVGGKAYGKQIDAMRSLGADPKRYLLTNVLWSFLLGAPLLSAIAYLSAAAASIAVFTACYPERGPWFWSQHYHRALARPGEWFYVGADWLLAKTLVCAAGIALIAFHLGARPKRSPRDVSQGVTSTILWATLYVLVVHFAFAFFEFEDPP